MATARLTYFKGKGLGELIRLMLAETGTPYEEITITKELMAELRSKGHLFFQQLPLLEMDGLRLVQSAAIVRYLARKNDMYGSNVAEAYYCDMIADGLVDLRSKLNLFTTFAERKKDPAGWVEKTAPHLPRYLEPLEELLAKNNGGKEDGFLLGGKISYVDVSLLEVLELVVENIPDALSKYRLLSAFRSRMLSRPLIAEFYSSGRRNKPMDDAYIAHVKQVLNWN